MSCTAEVPFELTWLTTDLHLRPRNPAPVPAVDDRGLGCQVNAEGPHHERQHKRCATENQPRQGDPGIAVCKALGSEREPAQCAKETPFPREGDPANQLSPRTWCTA